MKTLIFATRPSALARWQTRWVIAALQAAWPNLVCREEVITTQGDRILDRPLPEIGGKGLFTQELEERLLSGEVDIAVHSLKDLPVEDAPGLAVGALPDRAEVRDVLVSGRFGGVKDLPPGSVVGTSSLRRQAQLKALRPDLAVKPVRGNVDTRVRKALNGEYDAVLLAGAGVTRLGLDEHVREWLSLEMMLPAPGQGALAVQCRIDDEEVLDILAAIEATAVRRATQAERSFLQALGGGCSLPVGAFATVEEENIHLQAVVAAEDGGRVIRLEERGPDAIALGRKAAQDALRLGARELLGALFE